MRRLERILRPYIQQQKVTLLSQVDQHLNNNQYGYHGLLWSKHIAVSIQNNLCLYFIRGLSEYVIFGKINEFLMPDYGKSINDSNKMFKEEVSRADEGLEIQEELFEVVNEGIVDTESLDLSLVHDSYHENTNITNVINSIISKYELNEGLTCNHVPATVEDMDISISKHMNNVIHPSTIPINCRIPLQVEYIMPNPSEKYLFNATNSLWIANRYSNLPESSSSPINKYIPSNVVYIYKTDNLYVWDKSLSLESIFNFSSVNSKNRLKSYHFLVPTKKLLEVQETLQLNSTKQKNEYTANYFPIIYKQLRKLNLDLLVMTPAWTEYIVIAQETWIPYHEVWKERWS